MSFVSGENVLRCFDAVVTSSGYPFVSRGSFWHLPAVVLFSFLELTSSVYIADEEPHFIGHSEINIIVIYCYNSGNIITNKSTSCIYKETMMKMSWLSYCFHHWSGGELKKRKADSTEKQQREALSVLMFISLSPGEKEPRHCCQ